MTTEIAEDPRVAIARDVIAQVQADKIRACQGVYVDIEFDDVIPETASDLGEILGLPMITCDVCAKGALFLSKARLMDGVPLEGLADAGDSSLWITGAFTTTALADVFDKTNLNLIEAAFERRADMAHGSGAHEAVRAADFGRQHLDSEPRLLAIMSNIIANAGVFRP